MTYTQVELNNLSSHIVERIDKHFDVIFTKIAAVERTLHGGHRDGQSLERSVTDRLVDIETQVRALDDAIRRDVGPARDAAVTASPTAAAAAAGGAAGDVQSILVSTSEKMTIYEGVITVLNREIEQLSTKVC